MHATEVVGPEAGHTLEVASPPLQRLARRWSSAAPWDRAQKALQALLARLYLPGCRLGRFARVVGRPVVTLGPEAQIVLGERVRIISRVTPCELAATRGARLEIGARTVINYGTSLGATKLIRIGERCMLGTYVNVIDNNFHALHDRAHQPASQPVIIEDDVWLCNRVMVLPGAHIERGAVVGAGSIVSPGVRIGRDSIVAAGSVLHEAIGPRSVAMGNPAKVIYTLPSPSEAETVISDITEPPPSPAAGSMSSQARRAAES
jgi:acetyltransferase-like isoleucine patch superfamily enzyme